MSDRIEKYSQLCQREESIPLFSQAWWLDATAGTGQWDVLLVESGESIVAAMPYVIRKRHGLIIISQPPLTQTLGPWLRETGSKSAKRLEQQKEWMQALIDQLPDYAYYTQSWHWENTNWLPFYWQGFQQTTNYTYILQDLSSMEVVWKDMKENIRGDIKKAQNRFNVRVRDDRPLSDLIQLNRMTFERQGLSMPYSEAFLYRLDAACEERGARKILIAEDDDGRMHAGVYMVWDKKSAYYLMGGGDPALRNSGATSLCMWHAIQFAATVTRRFDFEGSMLEPVEKFFRAFGAEQTPYFAISKVRSRLLATAFAIKALKAARS